MLSFLISKIFGKTSMIKSCLVILIISLTISESLSAESSCTEQWTEIYLNNSEWSQVGDAKPNTDPSTPFYVEFEQQSTSTSDIGGAIWHSYDFSKKRGILISFKPTVKPDESYFGNVKYPQGFAIVFTSSSTQNLIGGKGPGLGYEGIMNAIAFEFDFVKQSNYGDDKKPHFSVNYNINGQISASTKGRDDYAFNIVLPNFYDNSLDGYYKNVIFEIEIIGKKLSVRSNREGFTNLVSTDFPEFQQLLEQDDVHIGITASMNQNKKIVIEDFKVSEVSVNEKGNLEIKKNEEIPKFKAGEEVALLYSINSICGEKLKIYPNEYSGSSLKLLINNKEVSPETISFDETTLQLRLAITETQENVYTALVSFNGQYSESTKFLVTSSNINRLELCDIDESNKYYLTAEIEQNLKNFYVPLCLYDEYGNRKQVTLNDLSKIKVGYPENLHPDAIIESNIDKANNRLIVTVPFNTFGEYEIFSEDFIQSKSRYVIVIPKYISPEKSDVSILYDLNIIQSSTSEVALRIKPKDNYGRNIPNIILEKMNCNFESSVVTSWDNKNIPIGKDNIEYRDVEDDVILKIKKPSDKGRYIFVPKVSCDGIELTELKCGINFETKINNCEFFYEDNSVSSEKIQLYDEYSGEYKTFSKGENKDDYLYVSIDQKENKKIAELILLDSKGSPYFLKSSESITSKLDNEDIQVISIGNKYALVLKKTRDNYSPVNTHTLLIKKGSVEFNIIVKFYSLDQYRSNTDITYKEKTGLNYIAFYKQNSLTVEASEILYLFEIYEQISGKNHFGPGDTLESSQVKLLLGSYDVTKTAYIQKYNSFIAVSTPELSHSGTYNIILKYGDKEIINMYLDIVPKKEPYYLADKEQKILDSNNTIEIDNEEHIRLFMADKFKNIIRTNEIFNAFSKIKISQMDIFDIKIDYSGIIHIYNAGQYNKSINLILANGNNYVIKSNYQPAIKDLDPLNSYGKYKYDSAFLTVKDDEKLIEVTLVLRDKYGNNITDDIRKINIDVYIEGKNIKQIIPMTTSASASNIDGINYKATLEKAGDYEIKIFIDNIPVECKACHFRLNADTKADVSKSVLYILGNKQKIPVFNSYQKSNNTNYIGLVDKSTGAFSFYLDERDKYGNEYKEPKSLTFTFKSEEKNVDTSSISICPTGNNEDERNYFRLCTGVSYYWKDLPEGLYNLSTSAETNVFKIYLTDSVFDSQDKVPDIKYSMVLSNTKEIYGKTDIPGSFILDLRTKNYKRIKFEDIDTSKITIKESSNTLKTKIVEGPEKGLLTVFLLEGQPGEYKFNIQIDGKNIINDEYVYKCSCGFSKKFSYKGIKTISNGNYAFFEVLDSKGNKCSQQYLWNELSIKEYADNIFKTKDTNYNFDTYYNIKSNNFIFYFDNHVNNAVTLTSDLIKFDDKDSVSLDLMTNILDENHFSVKIEDNKINISPLNANYEKSAKYNINSLDFDITLVRILNDDFVILQKDIKVNENLVADIDKSLMDVNGVFIYVVYYQGKELFCENCILNVTESNNVDMTKTKVYLKEGDDNYIQNYIQKTNNANMKLSMIKTNLPFFKINLYSPKNNLVLEQSPTITLEASTGELETGSKIASNGNIYVYLTQKGREAYWSLASMSEITLKVTNGGDTYEVKYYVLDYPIKMPSSIEYCSTGPIPNIINKQDIYIKRYYEELELEIYLSGCAKEQKEIKSKINIHSEKDNKDYTAQIIPTDVIGGYLMFIPQNISINDASEYYISNNKEKSERFNLNILPGYEIGSAKFSLDSDMVGTQSDKLYTYFMVELRDKYENIITNEGRNLFINDINILGLDNNLPHRFTYDQSKKAFRCQVPVTGYGAIKAKANSPLSEEITLNITAPKILKNSIVTLESENANNFTFSIQLKDEYYKTIESTSIDYKISFKYFTINPLTEEVFTTEITPKKSDNKFVLTLEESFPKYSIYGFIPYIGFLPQICPSCIKLNKLPQYIYTIGLDKFIPHNIEKKLYGIKGLDIPLYLYFSHSEITMELTNIKSDTIKASDKVYINLLYAQNSDIDTLQVNFKFDYESKVFSAKFIDNSETTEIGNKEVPPYIENYGYKVFNKNNLDNIHVEYFMDIRDAQGKLISTQPNLLINATHNGIIKKISVINTCFNGIYYIKITFSKAANIEFYPLFNTEQKKDNYITIQLNAISAFPTNIVLNNKEIITNDIVKFKLLTSNSYSEKVCDERLNIYINDMNLKNIKKTLVKENGDCYLYIKFSGKAKIQSNIHNFESEVNNNERTLYNINPQFSSLTIIPNVFENDEDTLELNFEEKSPAGIPFDENEVIANKNLYIYKYITPYKFQYIKTFSGLFSSYYPFSASQLNLVQGNTYVLIGDIVSNNIPPLLTHYKIKKSENETIIQSIKANYFTEEKRSFKLSNFFVTKVYTGDSLELSLPLLLKVQLLDSSKIPFYMDYASGTNLKAQISLMKESEIRLKVELNVIQYNDNTFYIKPSIESIPDILYLPVNQQEEDNIGYFINLSYNNTDFYSLLTLKQTDLQLPSIKSVYSRDREAVIDSFEPKNNYENNMIYIPKGIPYIQQICLYISQGQGKSGPIINQHLDISNLSLNLECTSSTKDFTFVNSYMGCFAFSTNCEGGKLMVTYNNIASPNKISIQSFDPVQSNIKFDKDETKSTKDSNDNSISLEFNDLNKALNPDFYKIFVNGERYEKTTINVVEANNQIILSKIDKVFNTIPNVKKVIAVYATSTNYQMKLMDEEFPINIIQKKFDNKYKVIVQETFDIKVGKEIKFYMLLYDNDKACYYGDINNLKNMSIIIKTNSGDFTTSITNRNNITGYSQCKYIYEIKYGENEFSKQAGNFPVYIEKILDDTEIYIAPKDIDKEKSSFSGNKEVKAGQTFYLKFSGTDSYGNKMNYYDLIKEFDIELIDKNNKKVEKIDSNYQYNIRVNSDNTAFNISLKINDYGEFTINALYQGSVLDLNPSFKIIVQYGQCSMHEPKTELMLIDRRNEYYIGETISVHFQCKDILGNIVQTEGTEIFSANIRQILEDKKEIKYDYVKTFDQGNHYISFTPSKIGNYSIDISLNGKKYGDEISFGVKEINRNKIHCLNKKQVDNVIDCDEDFEGNKTYRNFVQEILGSNLVCHNDTEQGKIYKCSLTSECITNTITCPCDEGYVKINGYCYPESSTSPVKNNTNNLDKITCKNKIKAKDPNTDVYICPDGSCRFNEEECITTFECPLGFKSCGHKCVLLNESCNNVFKDATCNGNDVLCWDLSCAKNRDLCPTRITCPKDKVLCPDGTCQSSGHCIQPLYRSCSSGEYQCADFSCVQRKEDCKKNTVCEPGLSLCQNGLCQRSCQEATETENKFRCANGQFVDNSKYCPSEIYTPSNYVKCPNGGIANRTEDCSFIQGGLSITCPKTKPILCPDLSCVSKGTECKVEEADQIDNPFKLPTCPPHKPYQCWNNECRRSFDECPTPVTCPNDFPVLCQNGFCVKSSDECTEKEEPSCENKYRCFDGTCVTSLELCPTHVYCGKDQIKCWNGACVNNINECRSPELDKCKSPFGFRCPDGSCRSKYEDCSTISVCPPNLPIKCFDNSCRASIMECPSYQSCGDNKVSCPDGTCALSYEECNTVVTCLSAAPFLCYDNTCKPIIDDCPQPPKCSKTEVLCPNGACTTSRQNCKVFDPCESIYPVKCDSNICAENSDKCNSRTKRCPEGYVLCDNGECKSSGYLCEKFECPKNKPILCPEGVCVHDPKLCDNEESGCPYNKPYKCKNGACVENFILCLDKNVTCAKDYKDCPDGSCVFKDDECPLKNGCYNDRKFKCADGTCINPDTTSCTPVLCPYDTPYKCPNGYCVSKSSDCPNDLFNDDLYDCGEGLIMCVDGRCVESTDYCRPLYKCENSYTKCADGTCRVTEGLCPKEIKCPESRPYLCDSYCVKNETECKNGYICPDGYMKCSYDGLCTENINDCRKEANTDSVCTFVNKKMCKNGRCINSDFDCSFVSDSCPDDDKPYLCPNGECSDDLNCTNQKESEKEICPTGKIMCSSGRCVENKTEILRTQCSNNIGCPLDKPYRCSSGECATSERKCQVTSILLDSSGNKTVRYNYICDSSKPYLCEDKTCVSDPSFCKVSVSCPEGMKKCGNGYCVTDNKNKEYCEDFADFCPSSNPIHCPSGACATDIIKCPTSFNIPKCNEGEFYCARMNKCMTKKLDCLLYMEDLVTKKNEEKPDMRLLFEENENIVNPLRDEEYIKHHQKKLISLREEDDPSDKDKDDDKDTTSQTLCYDGTIATGDEKCPIVPACKMGQYRCENGACASDKSLCPVDESYICPPNQHKCPDGFCHKDCSEVAFHGCEVNKYQCSNGQCLDDKYDCIGYSMCPDPAFPFRCISGECKSSPEDCEVIQRLGSVKNLTYSFNKMNKIAFNFAFDSNGRQVGYLEIPASGFNLENDYSKIYVEEVSSSLLKDSKLYNNSEEFLFNVSNSIIGSDGLLNFENSIMSPVFKFYSKENKISFKFNGKIDIAHNEYESSAFYYYDYCLAKLKGFDLKNDKIIDEEEHGWECVERQTEEDQTEFKISEFGVYAVILNPLRNKATYYGDSEAKNFFLENIKIILIVLAVIIVIVIAVFYIFSRITRYRKKYHASRERILLLKQQREEYENMTTDIFGQTLGDNINGIVYKTNPSYTVTEEVQKASGSLEDEIEKLQIECKNVTEQNDRLQKDIAEITKKYEQLSESIENANK